MPGAERSIVINRPADVVFAFLSDGTTAPQWRSGVLDITRESGEGVGAIYRQGVKGPGGRRVAADYRVTAFDPGHRIAFETIAGPVRPTGEFRVVSMPGGGSEVTFTLQAKLSLIKGLLMEGMVQKTMDSEMNALDKLKSVLEAQPVS
jgi:uncharacterized membrane protein